MVKLQALLKNDFNVDKFQNPEIHSVMHSLTIYVFPYKQ